MRRATRAATRDWLVGRGARLGVRPGRARGRASGSTAASAGATASVAAVLVATSRLPAGSASVVAVVAVPQRAAVVVAVGAAGAAGAAAASAASHAPRRVPSAALRAGVGIVLVAVVLGRATRGRRRVAATPRLAASLAAAAPGA